MTEKVPTKYLLDLNKLESGDIILTRSSSRESLLIRQISKCDYSHAILNVGVSSCIESNGLGVQAQNIQRLLFENPDDVVVLRLKEESLKSKLPGAIVFARQKIGTEYSTTEARLAKFENDLKAKETNRQFCTRFVAQAYEQAGVKIVDNPDYCTPQEILKSPSLQIIPNTTKIAADKEIQFASDKNNPLEEQRDIQNFIFEESRKISKCDIQTFEQLSRYVLENTNQERQITEVLKKSGYLEMWQKDVERNPWHYGYQEFLKHYTNPKQRKEVGHFWITTEKVTRERLYQTLKTLEFGYSFYQQDFFKLQIDLYKKLIELSKKREFVGSLALK